MTISNTFFPNNMFIIHIPISVVFKVKIDKPFLIYNAKRQIRGIWWLEK